MKLAIVCLAGVAALLAGGAHPADPAPAEGVAPSPCFRTGQIRNHTFGDSRTLYIGTDRDAVFRVDMTGACLATAAPTDPLIITLVGGGSDVICRPLDLNLKVQGPGAAPVPCVVSAITRMTPEEVAALPSALRP